MKTIDASTVDKFDPDVIVSGTELMTEELQAIFAKNSAFQGYMWVPCFCQSSSQSGVGPHWGEFILPKAELELCVKGLTSLAVPYGLIYTILQGSVTITENAPAFIGDYFYEGYIDPITEVPAITLVNGNGGLYKISITAGGGDAVPFAVFYRIVR